MISPPAPVPSVAPSNLNEAALCLEDLRQLADFQGTRVPTSTVELITHLGPLIINLDSSTVSWKVLEEGLRKGFGFKGEMDYKIAIEIGEGKIGSSWVGLTTIVYAFTRLESVAPEFNCEVEAWLDALLLATLRVSYKYAVADSDQFRQVLTTLQSSAYRRWSTTTVPHGAAVDNLDRAELERRASRTNGVAPSPMAPPAYKRRQSREGMISPRGSVVRLHPPPPSPLQHDVSIGATAPIPRVETIPPISTAARRNLPPAERYHGQPPFSWPALIGQALIGSGESCLTIDEIVGFIVNHYSYFDTPSRSWSTSISHVLSILPVFVRAGDSVESVQEEKWKIEESERWRFKDGWFILPVMPTILQSSPSGSASNSRRTSSVAEGGIKKRTASELYPLSTIRAIPGSSSTSKVV